MATKLFNSTTVIQRISSCKKLSNNKFFQKAHRYCLANHIYTSCSSSSSLKVAIIGAGGHIGRSLALYLKPSPLIDELAIYDNKPQRSLLVDLTHMNTRCRTIRHDDNDDASGELGLERALRGAKIVALISDTLSLEQEHERLENFIVPGLLKYCPKAFIAVISRSINSLLPMLFEIYKRSGAYECNRLFGVMNLYQTRANTYAAETLSIDPEFVTVPIIGGGCPRTCVPLFSQARPCNDFTPEELSRMMQSMRSADVRLAEAYIAVSNNPNASINPAESSSLCTGFAAARFCISLCKAIRDEPNVEECAYVRSCLVPELKYFGSPLELGPSGIQKHLGVPGLTNSECTALYAAIPEIKRAIEIGEHIVLGSKPSTEVCPVPSRCTALQPVT